MVGSRVVVIDDSAESLPKVCSDCRPFGGVGCAIAGLVLLLVDD